MGARRTSGQSTSVACLDRSLQGHRRHAKAHAAGCVPGRNWQSKWNLPPPAIDQEQQEDEHLDDDRLRLIFTCCHPALPREAQVAMTLREVCGLTTEEIARAFLTKPSAIAQRIVRAKAKIRDARIPYEVPPEKELPDRLDAVLRVVYLVFNEGYSTSFGDTVTRHDLCGEAIRLGRVLIQLLPQPEAMGLLGLLLLQDSRRAARTSATGELILLEDQDRSRWNREQITEGGSLLQRALSMGQVGPYTIQAAIAAAHAQAPTAAATDWSQIVGLYDPLATSRALAGDRTEPRRRRGDARRSISRPGARRWDPRAGRPGNLSLGLRGPGRSLSAAGTNERRPHLLRTGSEPHAAGTRAAISRETAEPTAGLRHRSSSSHQDILRQQTDGR